MVVPFPFVPVPVLSPWGSVLWLCPICLSLHPFFSHSGSALCLSSVCLSVCPCTLSLPFGVSPVVSSSPFVPALHSLLRVSPCAFSLSFCLSLYHSCPHGGSKGSVPWFPLVWLSLQPSCPRGDHSCALLLSVPMSLHLFFSLLGSVPCLSPSVCLCTSPVPMGVSPVTSSCPLGPPNPGPVTPHHRQDPPSTGTTHGLAIPQPHNLTVGLGGKAPCGIPFFPSSPIYGFSLPVPSGS